MGDINTRPREGTSALIAGITLFEKTTRKTEDGKDTNLVVQGSAQVSGEQKFCDRSVGHHGLEEALRQACEWRFERADVPYETPSEMVQAALAAVPGEGEAH